MPLIEFFIVLIAIGVMLWVVNSYIPMDAKIKNILNIAVVIAVILWICNLFGILGHVSAVRVGR